MLTDNDPCETAAGLTRTLLLITTVPVRELMITLAAALAGSTSRFSTVDRKATRWVTSSGARTRTDPPSMMLAAPSPMPLLTLATRRVAVVKSGSLRLRTIESPCASCVGTARSTVAPFGNSSGARHVDRELRAIISLDAEAADDQIALGDGVDLPVEPVQGREQQRAAAQTLGVGDGIDGDVDGLSRLDERRHHRMHGHRRHVLELRIDVRGHDDAQLGEHVLERLDGEGRLAGLIAGAVEPDHQPVADELVGAHALHLRHVLDALGVHEAWRPAARAARCELRMWMHA